MGASFFFLNKHGVYRPSSSAPCLLLSPSPTNPHLSLLGRAAFPVPRTSPPAPRQDGQTDAASPTLSLTGSRPGRASRALPARRRPGDGGKAAGSRPPSPPSLTALQHRPPAGCPRQKEALGGWGQRALEAANTSSGGSGTTELAVYR